MRATTRGRRIDCQAPTVVSLFVLPRQGAPQSGSRRAVITPVTVAGQVRPRLASPRLQRKKQTLLLLLTTPAPVIITTHHPLPERRNPAVAVAAAAAQNGRRWSGAVVRAVVRVDEDPLMRLPDFPRRRY